MGNHIVQFLRRLLPLLIALMPWLFGIASLAFSIFGAHVHSDMPYDDPAGTDWARLLLSSSFLLSFANIFVLICAACLQGLKRRIVIPACCNATYPIIVIAAFSPVTGLYVFLFFFLITMPWAIAIWMWRQ
jgi:hypothetical protein